MPSTFDQILKQGMEASPQQVALFKKNATLSYIDLWQMVEQLAVRLSTDKESPITNEPHCGERVAVYLPKQFESVASLFAISLANQVFVPINPLLKAAQVGYIMENCQVSTLITSLARYKQLKDTLAQLPSLKRIILTDSNDQELPEGCLKWEKELTIARQQLEDTQENSSITDSNAPIDVEIETSAEQDSSTRIAAILYTSGSTGQPKGVVLSHQNLVEGAKSVSAYLNNVSSDRLLAVLPFSFDYGLSQLTTAFLSRASVVLLEYLLPRDVINAVEKYQISGLAAVPPLWLQLADLEWPEAAQTSLRYMTNSGGAMPTAALTLLKKQLPKSDFYLMYGLTEAFRSTYLEPEQLAERPESMGQAIPNATILVINDQGEHAKANEEGELVHLGVHVSLGYWQNEAKTQQKFRPLPDTMHAQYGSEKAVWSGDRVRKDEQGYLYFIGRNDDMIKCSGYRISPAEIEEVIYQHPSIKEVSAIGVPDPKLGQAILLVLVPQKTNPEAGFDEKTLRQYCRQQLPNFMQPKHIELINSLPRNPNGKINRQLLAQKYTAK
jgi:acyl-CoA ligase (AMP-forming) (exosortase A-associated)